MDVIDDMHKAIEDAVVDSLVPSLMTGNEFGKTSSDSLDARLLNALPQHELTSHVCITYETGDNYSKFAIFTCSIVHKSCRFDIVVKASMTQNNNIVITESTFSSIL